jgi:hypothetical protein
MDDQIASKTQVKCRNKYELSIEINTVVLYSGRHIAMSAQNLRREILSHVRRLYNTTVFISMESSYLFLHLTCVLLAI